ncbi:multiple C2 and transmembrane domain-containing protein-like [Hyposmocoma kahamanoa]|uniref:multiple C2 and transmembrane domain-containing protein-like n=1 Tax=Hyposmocoma kahamanoa TaxID=1477025 RepID=UPI000E6D8DCE|nr:multiple C2 and transmembrane domain-containing protein-like [Hyposmocoma kahamanoa]
MRDKDKDADVRNIANSVNCVPPRRPCLLLTECSEKPVAAPIQTDLPTVQNGDKAVSLQELTAMSENDESVATELLGTPVLQCAENNGELRNNLTVGYSLRNDIESVEILELPSSPSVNNIGSDPDDPDASTTPNKASSSFGIQDGLVIDPLAPTALAVSSEFMDRIGSGLTLLRDHGKKLQKFVSKSTAYDVFNKSWKSIVNVVLVEARDLPHGPASAPNSLYCKFKLGNETHKSKRVSKSKANWRERFNLYLYDDSNLEVTVWHKGKHKNFMGRCIVDLSQLEKEKTHELWQELECGYGSIHLLVTLSATGNSYVVDSVPTTNGVHQAILPKEDFTWYSPTKWHGVGHLALTVYGAKGLSASGFSGKVDAYCVFELDNSRVQTHTVKGTTEPSWNKSYNFTVNDITSTLDMTVYNESIINSSMDAIIGKLSIPLLRINNDEVRWYALKDRAKKGSAKGNCPRILLQMSVDWNPVTASLRILSPKETKYVKKREKFNIPLIYSNLKFIKDIFSNIAVCNEHVKHLFEWDDRQKSAISLAVWLVFWYFMQLWMMPLLLLVPFLYKWPKYRSCNNTAIVPVYNLDDDTPEDVDSRDIKTTIRSQVYGLQELTFTIKNAIDYIVSELERLNNLTSFTVPYLSYLIMAVLLVLSVVLYFVSIRYLFMGLGIYKFTRKVLNPDRVPNNDILDFLSRVPDNETLKEWLELKVPEPNLSVSDSIRRRTTAN